MVKRADRAEHVAAALIFLGAAWLRFDRLGSQGLYSWDEMYLAEHARIFADFFRAAAHGLPELYRQVRETGGLWHLTAAKPTQYGLMTLASLVAGGGDLPLQALSAAFGLGSVALLYLWGRRWSAGAGLCSAALLGGLGGHVWYSRGLLAAAPASFFLLLGAYLFLREDEPPPRDELYAGISLGLAISTHYNVLPAAALVWLYAAARRDRRGAARLAAGILLPLLAWEAAFLLRNIWSPRPMLDYAGELRHYLFETSRRDPAQAWAPSLLLRWLILSSGAVSTALLAAGAAACAAGAVLKPRKPSPLLLAAALGPGMFLVWSFASLWWAQVARPVANLLPFLCLCAGVGWARAADALAERGPAARAFAAPALALLLFAAGAPRSLDFARTVSPYKRAGAFLTENPGSVAAWSPLVHYYAPALPFADAASDSGASRYVVADFRAPAGYDFGAPALLVLPFSRFDPRLACLEETTRPGACLRGELAFPDSVAIFARPAR
jgi:hypothetical protein